MSVRQYSGEPKHYMNMSHNNNQESEFQLCEYNYSTDREPEQSLAIRAVCHVDLCILVRIPKFFGNLSWNQEVGFCIVGQLCKAVDLNWHCQGTW